MGDDVEADEGRGTWSQAPATTARLMESKTRNFIEIERSDPSILAPLADQPPYGGLRSFLFPIADSG